MKNIIGLILNPILPLEHLYRLLEARLEPFVDLVLASLYHPLDHLVPQEAPLASMMKHLF